MENINIHINNIECRPYEGFGNKDGDLMYEFVKWENDISGRDHCYVISFAKKSKSDEYYDIVSVDKRPWELNDDDQKNYNIIVKMFFEMIEKI